MKEEKKKNDNNNKNDENVVKMDDIKLEMEISE